MCTVGVMAEESSLTKASQWAQVVAFPLAVVSTWFAVFPTSANTVANVQYASVMHLSPAARVFFLLSLSVFMLAGVLAGANLIKNRLQPPLVLAVDDTLKLPAFDWRPVWENLAYETSPGNWREVAPSRVGSNTALVVKITRQIPREGEGHADTTLKAILRIKGNASSPVQITNPYWKGTTGYETEFDVGHTDTLVIGCLEDSLLACYQNQHQHATQSNHFAVPKRALGTRTAFPAAGTVSVEITLFDVYKKVVLKKISFEVIFNTNRAIGPTFFIGD